MSCPWLQGSGTTDDDLPRTIESNSFDAKGVKDSAEAYNAHTSGLMKSRIIVECVTIVLQNDIEILL
jgi:hypothetical protein